MKPSWMNESNGVWTYEFNEIIDVVANFTQNWLEDNIKEDLYQKMQASVDPYTEKNKFDGSVLSLFNEYFQARQNSFSNQLEKIKVTEEENN